MVKIKFYNVKIRKPELVEKSKTTRSTIGKGKKKRNVLTAMGKGGVKLFRFVK